MTKDMHQLKKLLSALGMEYEKIDVCKDNCVLFYKEHKNETKCLKYGKLRFVEVVNVDGEKVMTKVAHKQFRYMHNDCFFQRKSLDTWGGIRKLYVRTTSDGAPI
jgi:hypothetical protein